MLVPGIVDHLRAFREVGGTQQHRLSAQEGSTAPYLAQNLIPIHFSTQNHQIRVRERSEPKLENWLLELTQRCFPVLWMIPTH